MGRTLVPRYLAALDVSTMSDAELHTLSGDIALAAKWTAEPFQLVEPMRDSLMSLRLQSI